MENNFLISAYGRSGTKFLSNLMNQSEEWTVLHEPRGNLEERCFLKNMSVPPKTLKSFNMDKYGEVNSYCRFYFDSIPTKKKGVIFREPKEIILSAFHRKNLNQTLKIIDDIHFFWETYKKKVMKDKTIFVIDFNLMVTDKIYLKNVLNHFGINDVLEINLKKVNRTENKKYNSFEDLPKIIKDKYNSLKWSP